jgi:hypothetical protein
MKKYKCIKIIGPYNGPFAENITTYILENEGKEIAWHSGPNKNFIFELNDYYINIFLSKRNIINYKKSQPIKLFNQTKLL